MKGIARLAAAVGIWLAVCVLTIGLGLIPLAIWALLVFVGTEARATKAQAELERTLMAGETLVTAAVQHRVFALFKRRAVLAITSSRVVTLQRGLIGGFRMMDMQWKDLKDVRIEQNVLEHICGSNLAFDHLVQPALSVDVDGVPIETATTIYAHAQSEEQAWEESAAFAGWRRCAPRPVASRSAPQAHPVVPSGSLMISSAPKACSIRGLSAIVSSRR